MEPLFTATLPSEAAKLVPMRLLAHLGDAVFHLFERERQILSTVSAHTLHKKAQVRVNAKGQAEILDFLQAELSEDEQDIVRRARNIKNTRFRKGEKQANLKATAFEALVGYLYLTDPERLKALLLSSTALHQK